MATTPLFDDIFVVDSVNSGRYDRVSRITATSTSSSDIQLTLDINSELLPLNKDQEISLAISASLTSGGNSGAGWHEPKPGESSLADDYDYVMYGTVYKFEEGKGDKISVYVSFGGLLLCLEGGYRKLSQLKQENVYLLIRR